MPACKISAKLARPLYWMQVKIHILTTGGTIEKVYSEQSGTVQNVFARINQYVERLRLPDTHIDVFPLMNKDSLEMTGPGS